MVIVPKNPSVKLEGNNIVLTTSQETYTLKLYDGSNQTSWINYSASYSLQLRDSSNPNTNFLVISYLAGSVSVGDWNTEVKGDIDWDIIKPSVNGSLSIASNFSIIVSKASAPMSMTYDIDTSTWTFQTPAGSAWIIPESDRFSEEYPVVSRIYKDTGVFECVKAVEKQEQLYSNWSGQFNTSTGTYALNNGWTIQINRDGGPLSTPYKLIRLRVNGGPSAGYIDYIWLTTDSNNNVTATTMSSAEDVINYVEGKQLVFVLCSEPTPSTSTNQNVIVTPKGSNSVKFTSSAGQFYNPNSGIVVNFSDVIGCTPSISRQGTATFSKIVEKSASDADWFATWNGAAIINFANGSQLINTNNFVANQPVRFLGSEIGGIYIAANINPSTSGYAWMPFSYWKTINFKLSHIQFPLYNPDSIAQNIVFVFKGTRYTFNYDTDRSSSVAGTYYTIDNPVDIPYADRYGGNVSISKDGVLTCAKLVEGDYEIEQKFIGTYSGNKLTFNNGYTVEVVSSYGGSTAVGSFNSGQITLSGYTSEQPSPSTAGSIHLVVNEGNISVSSYNPNLGTWYDDKMFYIDGISIQSYNGWVTGNVEYLKITNTLTNTSVYYHNTSSIKNNFYEEESGDDTWVLKSTDRYQKYLTSGTPTTTNYFLTNTGEQFNTSDSGPLVVQE